MDGPWKIYFEEAGDADASVRLIEKITAISSKAVWYRHPNGDKGKGPHYHGLVYDFSKRADTCREWIKEALHLDGTKQQFGVSDKLPKSLGGKKITDEVTPRYITYMTKGKFDVVNSKGYDEMELAVLRNAWVDYRGANANASANANVMVIYQEKEKKDKITQYMLARMAHSRYVDEVGADDINVASLIKIVIRVLKEHKKLAYKRVVANICQDILADINFEEYTRQILSMV